MAPLIGVASAIRVGWIPGDDDFSFQMLYPILRHELSIVSVCRHILSSIRIWQAEEGGQSEGTRPDISLYVVCKFSEGEWAASERGDFHSSCLMNLFLVFEMLNHYTFINLLYRHPNFCLGSTLLKGSILLFEGIFLAWSLSYVYFMEPSSHLVCYPSVILHRFHRKIFFSLRFFASLSSGSGFMHLGLVYVQILHSLILRSASLFQHSVQTGERAKACVLGPLGEEKDWHPRHTESMMALEEGNINVKYEEVNWCCS
ncbi:hypothetical protein DVH24_012837 [Malus domestica]|uniref:Uncharacterized protein n=1 Tax=Malus domestica TaxID=3750 RepID=A0A498HW66_MALDO|nr:hypothetical protein DVH24_012837 [Malus domestica]